MNLVYSSDLLLNNTFQAISWTLVHSLWQGLFLSFIAGIIIMLTRKVSASIRYFLLTTAFILFIFGIFITLFRQIYSYNSNLNSDINFNNSAIQYTPQTTQVATQLSYSDMVGSFLNHNASLIVLIWVLIIVIKSIQIFAAFFTIYRLKRNNLCFPGEYWKTRLDELSRLVGIKNAVQFFYSGMVKVPMMIGYFKPIILFPLSLVNKLSNEEVESILIHELAHIRRKDYLINLLQQCIEILFFFNPPLLWVSSLIYTERENCCDDMVIALSKNKRTYINALVAFQEYNLSTPDSSLAFTSKKEYLLQRVKRIIYNNNKSLNVMEKLFLASGLVLITVFGFTLKPLAQEISGQNASKVLYQKSLDKSVNKSVPQLIDTIPILSNLEEDSNKFTGSISTPVDGKQYNMEIENNILIGLSINGVKVENDKIKAYQNIADKKIAESRASINQHRLEEVKANQLARELDKRPATRNIQDQQQDEMLQNAQMEKQLAEMHQEIAEYNKYNEKRIQEMINSEKETMRLKEMDNIAASGSVEDFNSLTQKLKQEAEALSSLADNSNNEIYQLGKKQFSNTIKDLVNLEIEMSKLQANKFKTIAERNLRNSSELSNLTEKAKEQAYKAKKQAEHIREQAQIVKEQAKLYKKFAETEKRTAEKARNQAYMDMKEAELERMQTEIARKESNNLSEHIISDLLKENLINDTKGITISLNAKELRINGIKQSKAIFKKFKEKYVKTKDWNFNYTN